MKTLEAKNKRNYYLDVFIPLKGITGNTGHLKQGFILNFIEFYKKYKNPCSNKHTKDLKKNLLSFEVKFYFNNKYRGDVDNLLKTLFDSMQKSKVITNDNQIRKVEAEVLENSVLEGISLKIKKYNA